MQTLDVTARPKRDLATPVEDVQRVIASLLAQPGGSCTLEVLSTRLGVSSRSLQRRLLNEGLTFRDVLNGSSKELAEQLLKDEKLSVAKIAERVGFFDERSFARAFRHWTGVAPSQWRQGKRGVPEGGGMLKN